MVVLYLVAGLICVGLFKTFSQLDGGSTFVRLMSMCAVLNGCQIRGARKTKVDRAIRNRPLVMLKLSFCILLAPCKNVRQWIGLLECISNVDEGFRLMGSVCDS